MARNLRQRLRGYERPARLAAWMVLPVCASVYVWAWMSGSSTSVTVRVLAFMVPTALAMLGPLLAWMASDRGTRARVMWGGFAIATAFLFASEAYYALYQVLVSPAGPSTPSMFDVLNLVAALSFFGLLVSMSQLRFTTPTGGLQMMCGALAFLVAGNALLYRWFTAPLAAGAGHSAIEAAVWALYSSVGGALLLGCAWGFLRHRGVPWVTWQVLGIASVSAYAFVVLLWPLWYVGTTAPGDATSELLFNVGYMTGYHLFFMASVYWLTTDPTPWARAAVSKPRTAGSSASVAITTFALATVPLLALALYASGQGSFDRLFYFAGLAVTTLAIVLRTSLADAECMGLRASASADPLTSVLSRKAFMEELCEAIARARTYGTELSVAIVDIDDFARFNVVHGRDAGDAALKRIARSLNEQVSKDGTAARLGGDEFVLLLTGLSGARARSHVRRVVGTAADAASAGPEQIGLSAGLSSWPDDGVVGEDLLATADAALYWAKYQGKNRVDAYSEAVKRALTTTERARGLARKAKSDIVRALAAATDARDSATAYHSRQVAALAFLVAEAAGLGQERVHEVQMAALLHDVGKVAVPDSVLRKRSRLSPAERAVLTEHAELGARILAGTELAYMAPWVRAHHERWDGTGFPDGSAGPAIPLEARIIAACDLYDEMVSGTPERGPLSRSAAIQELDQSMGRALDPDVAEILIEVVGQGQAVDWSEAWLS